MSEVTPEVKLELTPESPAEQVEVAAPALTPVEESAIDQGWVPLEDWKASGRSADEWRPAKEFVERGELFKSIHSTKRELKQTQAALDSLARHHQSVYQRAYQDAMAEAKMDKRVALREGDIETVEKIEDEMAQRTAKHQQDMMQFQREQVAARNSGPNPEFETFANQNPWYITDKGLRNEADAIGFVYLNNGGTADKLLDHVAKEIKRKFPEKFGPVRRSAPNAVAAPAKETKGTKSQDVDLNENEREVMRTFVRQGVMTEAQYKAELKRVKDRS